MREGPYTKISAVAGVLGLFIAYLTLAYAIKWPPFRMHVDSSPQPSMSTGTGSRASPSPTALLDGVWIAQLASVPISAGVTKLRQMLAEVRSEIPEARYLNSSDYASLRPGYWMVYALGSFHNGNEVLAFCSTHGRGTRDQCIGRFLSHNRADRIYMCLPPVGSQTNGCYHYLSATG